jgi:glycosyltransferase involved in cell wall biosynthesis
MAQGTPVVATMHMGTRDVLEHARGVRIVAENETTFAHAVCELLGDAAARSRLALLAPTDAAKWSAREMAERLLKTYHSTIKPRAAVSGIAMKPPVGSAM